MKRDIEIPSSATEDPVERRDRSERYALKRDLQALEFNEAIAKRLKTEAENRIKCSTCGKEFTTGAEEAITGECPECLGRHEETI